LKLLLLEVVVIFIYFRIIGSNSKLLELSHSKLLKLEKIHIGDNDSDMITKI